MLHGWHDTLKCKYTQTLKESPLNDNDRQIKGKLSPKFIIIAPKQLI